MSSVLLGCAIGDALGVPFESKPADYELLLKWDGKSYLGSKYHNLLPGQYSDDTQMSLMVAESLVENNDFNPDDLSLRYVDWIASGRARGYGKTTLIAVTSLYEGVHWSKSGVPDSYGNGTAMRAAPFGVFFRKDKKALIDAVTIDSNMTHASNEALAGALAIALTTHYLVNDDLDDLLLRVMEDLPNNTRVKNLIQKIDSMLEINSHQQVLKVFGTKADVRQTVPSALYCLMKFTDCHEAMNAAIRAGYDSDTTAAIVGSLFGTCILDNLPENLILELEDNILIIELDKKLYNG